MANEKTNSPREAAAAVLAKAQKLLNKKTSPSMDEVKTEDLKKSAEFTSGLHTVEYHGLESSKYSPQQAALAVLAKAQDMLSETVSIRSEGLQKSAEAESGMHKVEYFSKAETGHEKGVHVGVDKRLTGISMAGGNMPAKGDKSVIADSKKEHHRVMGEMKSMKKPSLPKSEMFCSEHSMGKTEGVVSKAECAKCEGGMQKSEWSDLYADLEEMAKSEGNGSGDKKAPSNPMKPKIEEKPIERDYQDFETKPGHAPENDHREAPQAAPQSNPKEQHEGNNPPAGAIPADKTATGATPGTGKKGVHKLSFFMGHQHSKKGMKKGIALG